MFRLFRAKKHSPHRVLMLTAIFALAIAGGYLGGRLSASGFLEEQEPRSPIIIEDTRNQQTVPQSGADAVYSRVRESMAQLYRVSPRDLSRTGTPNVFTKNAFVGMALALTSDGWLVTTAELTPADLSNLLVIDRDHTLFRPQKIVEDTATPARFIKVASNLFKPASLSSDIPPIVTDGTLVSEWNAERQTLSLASYPKPATEGEAIQSSDTLAKRFNAEQVFSISGLALATGASDVVALASERGAVPMAYISQAFRSLLKNGAIKRPKGDIDYYDAEHVPFVPAQKSGGSLSPGATIAKAKPGAKLLAGDVITAINDDAVTAQRSVSELVNEYQPGDTVQVHIRRGSAILIVKHTLK